MWGARGLAVLGMLGSALVAAGAAPGAVSTAAAETIPSTPVEWCVAGGPRPCIVAATRNGVDVRTLASEWQVQASTFSIEGARQVSFNVMRHYDGDPAYYFQYDIGFSALPDVWVFRFDLGTLVPRVITGTGDGVSTDRNVTSGGSHSVDITASPVTVSGQCDQSVWPWTCPEWAASPDPLENGQWDGSLGGNISDSGQWEDVAQRNAMYGMDYWHNIAATDIPPQVVADPATGLLMLQVNMANRHYMEDGTTLVRGEARMRIPNSFLQLAYGVPNPALMTGTSLATSVSGAGSGTVNVYQDPTSTAMHVDVTNMTFSARILRVRRGTIVPTRPTLVRTTRVAPLRGRVAFRAAAPRGARVTGYVARCVTLNRRHAVTARSLRSPVVVRGLKPGRAYVCKVRATSRAGAGPWSRNVRMSARR